MSGTERKLWAQREVGEIGVGNSACHPVTDAPMVAGIECEAEPAIEVIGDGRRQRRADSIPFGCSSEPILVEGHRAHPRRDTRKNIRRKAPTWEQAGPELRRALATRTQNSNRCQQYC